MYKIKKYTIPIIMLLLLLCFTSCGEDEVVENTGENTSVASATTTPTAKPIIDTTIAPATEADITTNTTSAPTSSVETTLPTATTGETALPTTTEKPTQTLTSSPQIQSTKSPSKPTTQAPKPTATHVHNWTKANYQEAAKCTVCGTTKGTKLVADFEANKVKCTAQLNKVIKFTTRCDRDESRFSTGTVTFSDYSTFNSTYKHKARDGYVWQSVTMTYVFDDENAYNFGVRTPINLWDYYNENKNRQNDEKNEQGYGVFFVNYYGKEYECWWDTSLVQKGWEWKSFGDGTFILSIRISFNVPVGYDGVVVGSYDANNMGKEDISILNVYNEKCVLYRLPEAKKPTKTDKNTTKTSWTLTDGGDHIIAKNGTKVVKVPIDTSHLPQNYEDERNIQTVTVERTLRSVGDWILYKEDYIGSCTDKVTGNSPGFSGSTGWWKIKIDGTCQQKFELDVGEGSIAGYKDGYLYYVLLNGFLLEGTTECQWLCKIKITDDGNLSDNTFIVELADVDNENYKEAWIEGDWVYYSWYSRFSDDIYAYRVKLDGSINEEVK